MKPHENPFRSCQIDTVPYHSTGQTPQQLYTRFKELNYTAAITGPHGHGKTTLLSIIEKMLRADNVPTHTVFINDTKPLTWPQQKQLCKLHQPDAIILIDGIDLLNPLRRYLLLKKLKTKTKGILVISHNQTSLPQLIQCSTSPQLLEQITKALLNAQQLPMIEKDKIENLFSKHQGNIRNCLMELYDLYSHS